MRPFLTLAVLALFVSTWFPASETVRIARAQTMSSELYIGAGSCDGSNCHGGLRAQTGYIGQNEYRVWQLKDKHARAYAVLMKERSTLMAQNLTQMQQSDATKLPECLSCHSLSPNPKAASVKAYLKDGVSCEACHGPADAWLGSHRRKDNRRKGQSKPHMYNTKGLIDRAKKCVSCHVGDGKERNVDHRLIAAGHPVLTFELETFMAQMPPHWRDKSKDDWLQTKAWAYGQAVTLRAVMARLATRAYKRSAPGWPEFADFDCFACHREIRNVKSMYYVRPPQAEQRRGRTWRLRESDAKWQPTARQESGLQGMPGVPPWDKSQYLILRQLVKEVAPDAQTLLDGALQEVEEAMARVGMSDPARVAAAANRVVTILDTDIMPKLPAARFNAQHTLKLLQNISGDGTAIARTGVFAAEQAFMSLQALYVNYRQRVKRDDYKAIDDMFRQAYDTLQDHTSYSAKAFEGHLRQLNEVFTKP